MKTIHVCMILCTCVFLCSQGRKDLSRLDDTKTWRSQDQETINKLNQVQEFRTGATKHIMEVTHSREETKKVQKMLNDCKTSMADLEARNAQLEKQYQTLLMEMEQKELDHTLEVNLLKAEVKKLRLEMESILVELQNLMDAKLSLKLKITAYRKLLETEECRDAERLRLTRLFMTTVGEGESDPDEWSLQMKMRRGEAVVKVTIIRIVNGPVAIAEIDPEGKFVLLKNNPSSGVGKDINLTNWSLERTVDNKTPIRYTFHKDVVIKLGTTLKIWARDYLAESSVGDLGFLEQYTWGTGSHITTLLFNDKREEMASYIQNRIYA